MMKFRTLFGAAAILAVGLFAAPQNAAAITDIVDSGGDSTSYPYAGTLTLDGGAADTAIFDATSSRFNFTGSGSSSTTFSIATVTPIVFTLGNLVFPTDFTKALVTIGTTVVDLLATPNTIIYISVGSPFSVTTDIVSATGAGTFDFAIAAVPLPAGLMLLLTGLGGLAFVSRRRSGAAAA